MRTPLPAQLPPIRHWFGTLFVSLTLIGVAAAASGAAGATTRRESTQAVEPVSARAFVEAQLKALNYRIVQLLQARAPLGFPTGENIEYLEAMGAYSGRRPQTIQLAIAPSGRS